MVLIVSYDLKSDWQAKSTAVISIMQTLSYNLVGSGAGFGRRDLEFCVTEKVDTEDLATKIKTLLADESVSVVLL
jgi:hypothetical protein